MLSARVLLLAALLTIPACVPTADPADSGPDRLERIRTSKMPAFDRPVMYDTPEADAICSALEVFPPDNPWNTPVEDWPLHPDSKAMVASVGADKPLRYTPDMAFVLVPPDQKKVEVKLVGYPDESDRGPYPVPDNIPIEGWPAHYRRYLAARREVPGADAGGRAARQGRRRRGPARDRGRPGEPSGV